jgi:hypothetical protein
MSMNTTRKFTLSWGVWEQRLQIALFAAAALLVTGGTILICLAGAPRLA